MIKYMKAKEKFNEELLKFKSKQEMFNCLFQYDDGKIYWKNNLWKHKIGKEAGYISESTRCCSVYFDTYHLVRSRIIYEMHFGHIFENLEIIHNDNNKFNDKIENLSLGNHNLLMLSSEKPRVNNTSGFRGVSWHKVSKKWQTSITKDQKLIYLGLYHDKSTAIAVYNKALENAITHNKEEIKEIIKKYRKLELAA